MSTRCHQHVRAHRASQASLHRPTCPPKPTSHHSPRNPESHRLKRQRRYLRCVRHSARDHEDDFDTFYSNDLAIPHSICRRTVTGCMLCMRVAETVRFARGQGVIGWESSDRKVKRRSVWTTALGWYLEDRRLGAMENGCFFLYRTREGRKRSRRYAAVRY